MDKQPLVYIIVLNYKGIDDTIECLESIKKISYNNYRVIIVDNYSCDGSEEKTRNSYPEYTIIQTGKNLGYAGGNNIGIKHALDRDAQYICILNNDVIVENDFLETVIIKLEKNPDWGIAGPKVCEYYDREKIH